MFPIPSPRRSFALLIAALTAQFLLLAVQIRRDRQVRLIRIWAVEAFTPFQRAGTFTVDRIYNVWSNYVGLRHARQENEQLRAELNQLRLRADNLQSRTAEASRLEALLAFREAHADVPMLAAQVISASPGSAARTVIINRGEKDGLKRNMGVITPAGVVGKILEVSPHSSQVLLLTDRDSGVGALLEGSRTQGVVKGTGGPEAQMEYVINDEEVAVGTRILTSGMDRIFPKDLPVATVTATQRGNPMKVIRVRPTARLDRLEEVLVLLSRQEFEPAKQAEPAGPNTPATTADQTKAPPPANR